MRRILISIALGTSMFALVSCGNKVVNEADIKNKYPIDSYLKKGATLDEYLLNGTAVLKDTNGEKFFACENSSYKVILSDDGVIVPYIVINNIPYYYDGEINKKEAPKELNKSGKINTFGGTIEGIEDSNDGGFSFINSLVVYKDKDNNDLVYTQYKDEEGYLVWKGYKLMQWE